MISDKEYIQVVRKRLIHQGYKIKENVKIDKEQFVRLLAWHKRLEITKTGYFTTVVVIPNMIDVNNTEDLEVSVNNIFQYCVENIITHRSIFSFGIKTGLIIIGYTNPSPKPFTAHIFSRYRRSHFGKFVIPVLVDTSTQHVYYNVTTPVWGRLYYKHFREIISKTFTSKYQKNPKRIHQGNRTGQNQSIVKH